MTASASPLAARAVRTFMLGEEVSRDQAWFFDQNGFIVFPAVFSSADCETIRGEARKLEQRVLAGEIPLEDCDLDGGTHRDGTRFINRLLYFTEYCPKTREIVLGPCSRIARGMYGDHAWLAEDTPPGVIWQIKHADDPGGISAIDWHIDQQFTLSLLPTLAIGIYLEESRADNGSLIVVPGSHREPQHRAFLTPLALEADAGDVICHSASALHASAKMLPESRSHREILYVFASGGTYPGHRRELGEDAIENRGMEPAFRDVNGAGALRLAQ